VGEVDNTKIQVRPVDEPGMEKTYSTFIDQYDYHSITCIAQRKWLEILTNFENAFIN
jgi:hypothetical protein